MRRRRIVIASGGFDPVHSGHVAYLNAARQLGDELWVGVNSDAWLERKKGYAFLPLFERAMIIANLRSVDQVVAFDDSDGSATELILSIQREFPGAELVFANGGDRTAENSTEQAVPGVEYQYGVGGCDKRNSSSEIVARIQQL
jgi:D-beta-D-heptose 7-phosphate kinase/D-beta-D-heptose 1-phosphate adenosyltransferase